MPPKILVLLLISEPIRVQVFSTGIYKKGSFRYPEQYIYSMLIEIEEKSQNYFSRSAIDQTFIQNNLSSILFVMNFQLMKFFCGTAYRAI